MTNDDFIEMFNPERDDDDGKEARPGRWPQIMIFLNGFVLTFASVITLFIYIDRIDEANRQDIANEFINEIQDKAAYLNDMFEMYVASNNPQATQSINHIDMIIRNNIDEQSIKIVYGGMSSDKFKMIKNAIPFLKQGQNILTNNDLFAMVGQANDTRYIASINMDFIQALLQKPKFKTIHKVNIFDPSIGHQLAEFDVENIGGDQDIDRQLYSFNISEYPLDITLETVSGSSFFMSDKLPVILLLFGSAITLIGTLFVRNNQRQSYRMNQMNAILAEKNDALEYKIEEAEMISEALRESEDEYRAVVNSVQDVLFELDVTGSVVFMNDAWEKLSNMPKEDAYGTDIFNHIPDNDRDRVRMRFFDFVRNPNPVQIQTHFQGNGQTLRAVNIMFSVLRKDGADIPHAIGTITDIEDKQQAVRALDEAEKRYGKIVENAAGGIYQIGMDGHIMNANPSYLHILGYSSLDHMSQDISDMRQIYVSQDDRNNYNIVLKRNGFIRNRECQIRNSAGDIIWINENARLVYDDRGEPLYYEGSIEDITQRKRNELALIEAKLNSDLASRAKSEFLANMSHELRTPLNSIIGFSEIIKTEALGEIAQKPYIDYAKDIHNSGTRLLSVINEILGISKIEAGERNLNESVVKIPSLAQSCVDLMATKIEASSLTISNMIDADLPDVIAEELALKQIIMNVLSNAIKFTPEGGAITLSSDYSGDDLSISITDTGIGIDEADIVKALSPFGQVDASHARGNSGTGLGLTLVDSLMRMHGGSIDMVSQKGFGTTVTLFIPNHRVSVKKVKASSIDDQSKVANLSDYKK